MRFILRVLFLAFLCINRCATADFTASNDDCIITTWNYSKVLECVDKYAVPAHHRGINFLQNQTMNPQIAGSSLAAPVLRLADPHSQEVSVFSTFAMNVRAHDIQSVVLSNPESPTTRDHAALILDSGAQYSTITIARGLKLGLKVVGRCSITWVDVNGKHEGGLWTVANMDIIGVGRSTSIPFCMILNGPEVLSLSVVTFALPQVCHCFGRGLVICP